MPEPQVRDDAARCGVLTIGHSTRTIGTSLACSPATP
jgi:hypothetical protein